MNPAQREQYGSVILSNWNWSQFLTQIDSSSRFFLPPPSILLRVPFILAAALSLPSARAPLLCRDACHKCWPVPGGFAFCQPHVTFGVPSCLSPPAVAHILNIPLCRRKETQDAMLGSGLMVHLDPIHEAGGGT